MVIFIDDNLQDIKNYLNSAGYIVNPPDSSKADVYIYSGSNSRISNMYNSIKPGDNGCFLINADEMTINEILYSLNHRTYSPLF